MHSLSKIRYNSDTRIFLQGIVPGMEALENGGESVLEVLEEERERVLEALKRRRESF